MKQQQLIRKIEELSMNALPALQTQLDDGWVLRYANGYTKRANSINPLYPSYDEDVIGKITRSEAAFAERNIQIAYKITPLVTPGNLDRILETNGYHVESRTAVQVVSLVNVEAPCDKDVLLYNELPESRFHDYCRLNHISDAQPTFRKMLANIVPRACFMFVTDHKGATIACGLGVLEDGYIGLFNIATDKEYRNLGHGTKLVSNLLYWGKKNGANAAYLQVVHTNEPALALYSKWGFKEFYRYWFRVKA